MKKRSIEKTRQWTEINEADTLWSLFFVGIEQSCLKHRQAAHSTASFDTSCTSEAGGNGIDIDGI